MHRGFWRSEPNWTRQIGPAFFLSEAMKEKQGPRERIVSAAGSLFYRRGFGTGINEILGESGAHKLSLYQYFPSKDDLGREYVERQKEQILSFLAKLIQERPDPGDFIKSWVQVIKRQARKKEFFGCPFANFAAQTLEKKPEFRDQLGGVLLEWQQMFSDYFAKWQASQSHSGRVSPAQLARRTLAIYEGNVQLYLISGDAGYLDAIEADFVEMIGTS